MATAAQRVGTPSDPGQIVKTDPVVGHTPALDTAMQTSDAFAAFRKYLIDLGMDPQAADGLVEWGWSEIQSGKSQAEIELDILNQPQIKAEFPELEARRKQGRPVSIDQIIAYRTAASDLIHAYGLPPGFASKGYVSGLISGDVSMNEFQDRVVAASNAIFHAPPQFQAELDRLYANGYTHADAVAMALDPTVAEPEVERRFAAARLGAQAVGTGYGSLNRGQLEGLASQGITEDAARQGFGALTASRELVAPLPGESGSAISQDEQLSAAFSGNAAARARIEAARAKRRAQFSGGGGLASGRQGVSGLGSASGA